MSNNLLDVSSFMEQLKRKSEALTQPSSSTKSDKSSASAGIQKIFMHAPPNQGSITLLPFSDPNSKGNYITYLDKEAGYVKQFKMKKYKDSKEKDWIRILPKIYYGSLSNEDSALYDEVTSLFSAVQKSKKLPGKEISVKTYILMYGYILNHFDSKQKKVDSTSGKIGMLVVPSRDFSDKQYSNINELTNKIPEDKRTTNWTLNIYNDNVSGRQSYLKISFTMNADGKGYTTQVNHLTNNPNDIAGLEVPEDLVITEDQLKLLSNGHIKDFLGWQVKDGKLFNTELYLRIRDYFSTLLAGANVSSTPTSDNTTPNQADSVIANSPEPVVNPAGHVDPIASIPVESVPTVATSAPNAPLIAEVPNVAELSTPTETPLIPPPVIP